MASPCFDDSTNNTVDVRNAMVELGCMSLTGTSEARKVKVVKKVHRGVDGSMAAAAQTQMACLSFR
ncbi:MAG TPA: hypothetical protein DCM86_07895 [Verrucomicrobiales bacterium]|nr:hypothetical protein [Verrucomicrobiales bacterium]